ncbi:hypothetical protein K227x_29690 [Rubripirellula lacrimiformis]|uniref:Uncharacterized protein n=1 Tax=Rubripirellula lacrimiformis TaxID=1930273 RepID=A0A517NBR1_9BACT|nr:hypothetical protein [Rubripirellula lacrimiformis]QDT04577.1 hypothetical protein K227x_29690 [Rubripirellula lacrimiformis]
MKYKMLLSAVACFALTGCSDKNASVDSADDSSAPVAIDGMPPSIDAHAHPEHGPHGGELVELGKEAFHLEMVHAGGAVGFFVLDGSATKPVAIDAKKLTVSLKHDGEVKVFELAAEPQAEDEAGKASRYSTRDEVMDQWMDAGAEGAVVVEIDGKSFTGKISHDHDHAGHDHGDHEGHDH